DRKSIACAATPELAAQTNSLRYFVRTYRRIDLATSTARAMSEFSNPNLEMLITTEAIKNRIRELGADIARDYAGRNPLLIGVLKRACTFLSHLMRAIDIPAPTDFTPISSH